MFSRLALQKATLVYRPTHHHLCRSTRFASTAKAILSHNSDDFAAKHLKKMTVAQLKEFATFLNISKQGKNKSERIDFITNQLKTIALDDLQTTQLQNYCSMLHLSTEGNSPDLTQRLKPFFPTIEIESITSDAVDTESSTLIESVTETAQPSLSTPMDLDLKIEPSPFAHLADGSAIVTFGNTVIQATAVANLRSQIGALAPGDGVDLRVDAREPSSPRGFIPNNFKRNELGISDYEVLLCRMIDRSIRPLLGYSQSSELCKNFQVQITTALLSCDDSHDTQVLAINAASAALAMSGIPWDGPIAAVRIARCRNEFIVNPTAFELENSNLNLLYVGTKDKTVMIETEAKEIPENLYCEALRLAQTNVEKYVDLLTEFTKKYGKHNSKTTKRSDVSDGEQQLTILRSMKEHVQNCSVMDDVRYNYDLVFSDPSISKNDRNDQLKQIRTQAVTDIIEYFEENPVAELGEDTPISKAAIESVVFAAERECFRLIILETGRRCDDREVDDLRAISGQIQVLPSAHGSSLFSRGNTQSLCTATLGAPNLARARNVHIYNQEFETRRLYFHYDMPPYATNEIKNIGGGPNRRAQGHGALAEKALLPLLPDIKDFPYAMRIFSTIPSSDGSSSMASVCGGSLALMDAGVPMFAPVAGISIGMVSKTLKNGKIKEYKLLTDIAGIEDHFGDMDFKMAGSVNGITAVQMDMKLSGIPVDIMIEAVTKARDARLSILDSMSSAISTPREQLSENSPRVEIMNVPIRDIPLVIGSGGHVMKRIEMEAKCKINISWDTETVEVCAPSVEKLNLAKKMISDCLTEQVRSGDVVTARIKTIQDFGVMVETTDGKEHLVHKNQWMLPEEMDMSSLLKEGDDVDLMCVGYLGPQRPHFSRKAAVWQATDDPEARAKLHFLLSSSKTPSRSRSPSAFNRATPRLSRPASQMTLQMDSDTTDGDEESATITPGSSPFTFQTTTEPPTINDGINSDDDEITFGLDAKSTAMDGESSVSMGDESLHPSRLAAMHRSQSSIFDIPKVSEEAMRPLEMPPTQMNGNRLNGTSTTTTTLPPRTDSDIFAVPNQPVSNPFFTSFTPQLLETESTEDASVFDVLSISSEQSRFARLAENIRRNVDSESEANYGIHVTPLQREQSQLRQRLKNKKAAANDTQSMTPKWHSSALSKKSDKTPIAMPSLAESLQKATELMRESNNTTSEKWGWADITADTDTAVKKEEMSENANVEKDNNWGWEAI